MISLKIVFQYRNTNLTYLLTYLLFTLSKVSILIELLVGI